MLRKQTCTICKAESSVSNISCENCGAPFELGARLKWRADRQAKSPHKSRRPSVDHVTCARCHTSNSSNNKFCGNCGATLHIMMTENPIRTHTEPYISPSPNQMMNQNASVKSQAGFIIGIVAIIIMAVALFPCIAILNWINIPVAIIGLILNIMAISESSNDGKPMGRNIAGAIMSGIAIVVGGLRLIVGGGIL